MEKIGVEPVASGNGKAAPELVDRQKMKKLIYIAPILLLAGCAANKETQSQVSTITFAIADYQQSGSYISTLENKGIYQHLVVESTGVKYKPYERSESEGIFVDAWGGPLRFFQNEQNQIVAWSAGRDGVFDPQKSGDDIVGMTPSARKESIQSR